MIKTWQERLENSPHLQACGAVGEAMQAEIDELREENARQRKLLEDCQYALGYSADMTKPEGLSGCDCPICATTLALHKELGEKP